MIHVFADRVKHGLFASLFLLVVFRQVQAVVLLDEASHSPPEQTLVHRIATESVATTSDSPTPFPSFHPSSTTTPARTARAASASSSSLHWSFMIPVLSALSLAAVAIRNNTRRCTTCLDDVIFDDSPPQEIIITRTQTTTTTSRSSAIGDRATDVELVPVWTMRSHDWAEAAEAAAPGGAQQDALSNMISRSGSDWIASDQYSESVADFVHME